MRIENNNAARIVTAPQGRPVALAQPPGQVIQAQDIFQRNQGHNQSPNQQRLQELRRRFDQTKSSQGWLGSAWDWVKNNLGCSSEGKSWYNPLKWWGSIVSSDHGSRAVSKQLDELERTTGSLSTEEFNTRLQKLNKNVDEYKQSQENGVDFVSDIVSGIVSYTAYTIAAASLAIVPFTGGSSLLITAGALTIAAGAGSLTKAAIKSSDAKSGGRKYNSFSYDIATGAFAGILAPITGAGSSAVAGFIARKAGLQVVSYAVGKSLTTEIGIQGGRFITRFGIRGVQLASEGASMGSLDSTFKHICKTGSLEGADEAFVSGFTGGLILSPIIGGGLRGVGRLAKKQKGIEDAIKQGKADMKNVPVIKEGDLPSPIHSAVLEAVENPQAVIARASRNKGLRQRLNELLKHNQPEIEQVVRKRKFQKGDNNLRAKMLAERSIGTGKMAQILADDPRVPANVRKYFGNFKSNITPTRNIVQAQAFVDRYYGSGRYEIIRSFGSGTVGETYLARALDGAPVARGTEVVIKMLRRGATPKKLLRERNAFREIVREQIKDPKQQAYYLKMVNNYFKGWVRELDFLHEAQAAKILGEQGKRFRVAQPIEVARGRTSTGAPTKRGVSLVLHIAPGISLDKLMRMLEVYRTNPARYAIEFADEIRRFPWLAHPERWTGELPHTYLAAQNEQAMFVFGRRNRVSHGDPHAGNVFVDFQDGRLALTYIDTGLTVSRNGNQVIHNIGMCTDLITGNSRGLARRIIDSADSLSTGKTRQELINELAKMLDSELFKKGINLTNPHYTQNTLNSMLERLGVIDSPTQALFFKSQMQSILHYLELSRLTGQQNNMLKNSVGDIFRGLREAFFTHPPYIISHIFGTLWHFISNPTQSIRTLTQFLSKAPKT